ncbi:hypothetical protein PybrP1_011718 [[Pythium] brassicae (nom. inval.)]|nr:hypothetical protein PybrP1_011718 [[Pythium] brassicae (nom. inval.)]
MALSRNFRTTYYKTLGVPVVQHIVDVDASYAALLAEPVVNRAQLVKLAQEVGVPAHCRELVWQLLAGVLPPHAAIWGFAMQERALMYEDALEAALALHPALSLVRPGKLGGDDATEASDATPGRDCAWLTQLHRAYWLEILVRSPLRGMEDEAYVTGVATMVCEVVAGEVERFWCFTKLLELFAESMGQYKAAVSLASFHEASSSVVDFEVLFTRIVETLRKDKEP